MVVELSWMERYRYHDDQTLAVTALVTLMTLELHQGKEEALDGCFLRFDP